MPATPLAYVIKEFDVFEMRGPRHRWRSAFELDAEWNSIMMIPLIRDEVRDDVDLQAEAVLLPRVLLIDHEAASLDWFVVMWTIFRNAHVSIEKLKHYCLVHIGKCFGYIVPWEDNKLDFWLHVIPQQEFRIRSFKKWNRSWCALSSSSNASIDTPVSTAFDDAWWIGMLMSSSRWSSCREVASTEDFLVDHEAVSLWFVVLTWTLFRIAHVSINKRRRYAQSDSEEILGTFYWGRKQKIPGRLHWWLVHVMPQRDEC